MPIKTKRAFVELADIEFSGDWGMCLKWLLDFYIGTLPNGLEEIHARLERLEQKPENKKQKREKIISLGGNEIK